MNLLSIAFALAEAGENEVKDMNISRNLDNAEKNGIYYSTILFMSNEEIDGHRTSKIIYHSNLISASFIIDILKDRFGNDYIDFDNNGVHLKVSEQFDSVVDYQNTIKVDNIGDYLSFKEEKLFITTDHEGLWDLYYFLRNYTPYLEKIIDAQNNWALLSDAVKQAPQIVLNISLNRLLADNDILRVCKNNGLEKVNDLIRRMPLSLNAFQIKNIINSVASIDYIPLNQLLLIILKRLNDK